jgi:hypothetical protein
MDLLPACQQESLLLAHDTHGAADLAAAHGVGPDQRRAARGAAQVDLGLAVTEDVDVRRQVVVDEDDHAQALGTKRGDHGVL